MEIINRSERGIKKQKYENKNYCIKCIDEPYDCC
jgi:hypothetical protein